MTPTPRLSAHVEKGRLRWRDLPLAAVALSKLEGCDVDVTVTKHQAGRSLRANAYLWGVVNAILADYTGYTPDEMHECLKRKFLPKTLALANKNGELIGEEVIGGSTAKLNTSDFADYVTRIKAWAMDQLGVYIPDPNEPDLATYDEAQV